MTVFEQTLQQLRAMSLTRAELVALFRKNAARSTVAASVVAEAAATLLALRHGDAP